MYLKTTLKIKDNNKCGVDSGSHTFIIWVTYGNILCFPSIEKKVCSFSQNYYDNKISKTFQ